MYRINEWMAAMQCNYLNLIDVAHPTPDPGYSSPSTVLYGMAWSWHS